MAISYSPADGSIWGSNLTHPGYIMRLAPGSNPPDTALAEIYKVPLPGFGIRGMRRRSQRRRCGCRSTVAISAASTGASARVRSTGRAPSLATNVRRASRSIRSRGRASRAIRARRKRRITPGSTSTTSSASAPTCRSRPATSRTRSMRWSAAAMVELRVPYPMGFFAKGLDGRIDDEAAGWKGRGLWVTSGNRTPMHIEGDRCAGARRARRDPGNAVEPDGGAVPAAARSAGALSRADDRCFPSSERKSRETLSPSSSPEAIS